jgi:hypothetical protein
MEVSQQAKRGLRGRPSGGDDDSSQPRLVERATTDRSVANTWEQERTDGRAGVWITNLVTRSKSGHRSTGLVDLPQIPFFHLDGGVLQADGLWTRGT